MKNEEIYAINFYVYNLEIANIFKSILENSLTLMDMLEWMKIKDDVFQKGKIDLETTVVRSILEEFFNKLNSHFRIAFESTMVTAVISFSPQYINKNIKKAIIIDSSWYDKIPTNEIKKLNNYFKKITKKYDIINETKNGEVCKLHSGIYFNKMSVNENL